MDDNLDQAPGELSQQPAGETLAVATLPPPVPAGLRDIWRKWLNVTTRPGVASFARELPTANWRDTLLSLAGPGFLAAIGLYFSKYSAAQILGVPDWNAEVVGVSIPRWVASAAYIILQPLASLFLFGILFVVAKGLGGKGTFLEHAYALVLFYAPLYIAIAVADYVPVIGHVAVTILNLYELVLLVLALAASHRFTVGRSVVVVVATPILFFLVAFVVGIVYVIFGIAFHLIPSPH